MKNEYRDDSGKNVPVQSVIDMAVKQIKMTGLYGARPVDNDDDIIFVEEADGTCHRFDHQELEEYIDLHQNEDFRILRVRENIVDFIEEETLENRW